MRDSAALHMSLLNSSKGENWYVIMKDYKSWIFSELRIVSLYFRDRTY